MQTPLSNEQKLEYIYRILVRQEKSRKTSRNIKIAKWILIGCFALFILKNPEVTVSKFTSYVQPMVMSSMSGIISEQKQKSLDDMQKMLQDIQNNSY